MKLFNKKYVYLEWDDKLEGKDCILAHSYKDLKDFVNGGDEERIFKVDKGTEKPFTNHWRECDFCYFDPNIKVKKALLEGNVVQFYNRNFDRWEDLNLWESAEDYLDSEDWDGFEWRIKKNNVVEDFCPLVEDKYYLSVNETNYLEFTILKDRTNDTIYSGTRKECERMMKIIADKFKYEDYRKGNSCRARLRYAINKYSHVKYKRRMTNRELSEYLAKGKGEMTNDYGYFSTVEFKFILTVCASYNYVEGTENKEVGSSIRIRDFGSDEWREPLIEV